LRPEVNQFLTVWVLTGELLKLWLLLPLSKMDIMLDFQDRMSKEEHSLIDTLTSFTKTKWVTTTQSTLELRKSNREKEHSWHVTHIYLSLLFLDSS